MGSVGNNRNASASRPKRLARLNQCGTARVFRGDALGTSALRVVLIDVEHQRGDRAVSRMRTDLVEAESRFLSEFGELRHRCVPQE